MGKQGRAAQCPWPSANSAEVFLIDGVKKKTRLELDLEGSWASHGLGLGQGRVIPAAIPQFQPLPAQPPWDWLCWGILFVGAGERRSGSNGSLGRCWSPGLYWNL